jgi:hypothetical protein
MTEPAAVPTPVGDGRLKEVASLTCRCARPACRREFRREVTRGRPQLYCSETCRGNADREYRAARTVVAHYEDALELARADVAAFGRDPDSGDNGDSGDSGVMTAGDRDAALATAREALAHARAVADYAPAEDPRVRDVLRELVAAVHPILARVRQ